MACYVCQQPIDAAYLLEHYKCGCKAHAMCLAEPVNNRYCVRHDPDAPATPAASAAGVAPMTTYAAAHAAAVPTEPRLTNNRNYCKMPGTKKPASSLLKAAAYVPYVGARLVETVENSTNPEFLLKHHVPVRVMMERNGLGLDHMLEKGITLEDFLNNNYTWTDLLQYEAVAGRRGNTTKLEAVCVGLRASANQFVEYPVAFPYAAVRDHTEMEPCELSSHFGLAFPVDGPLECDGYEWKAKECAKIGLMADDLFAIGLKYKQQYDDLMEGLSGRQLLDMERRLGMTADHKRELIDLDKLMPPPPPPPAQRVALVVQPPVQDVIDEMDQGFTEPLPPQPARAQRKPVAVAQPAPPPLIVHRTPPHRPATKTPMRYTEKRQALLKRHGALFTE